MVNVKSFNRLVEDEDQPHNKYRFWSKVDRKVIFIAASAAISTILVVLLIMFAVQGSIPTNQPKVISTLSCGQRPGAFQRPWIAEVYFRRESSWSRPNIMGVILSSRYILTPASAYSYYYFFGVRVLFGEIYHPHTAEDSYFANRTYRDVMNANSVIHENFVFGASSKFNLALLRFDKDIEFNDRIQPMCLPNVRPEPPKVFTILPDVVDVNSTVTRVDFGRCSKIWQRYSFRGNLEFSEGHTCVKLEREHDDCYGIEGSPLLGSFVDHGVQRFVQYGFKYCGNCTDGLQIYTDVSYHLEWILEKIKT